MSSSFRLNQKSTENVAFRGRANSDTGCAAAVQAATQSEPSPTPLPPPAPLPPPTPMLPPAVAAPESVETSSNGHLQMASPSRYAQTGSAGSPTSRNVWNETLTPLTLSYTEIKASVDAERARERRRRTIEFGLRAQAIEDDRVTCTAVDEMEHNRLDIESKLVADAAEGDYFTDRQVEAHQFLCSLQPPARLEEPLLQQMFGPVRGPSIRAVPQRQQTSMPHAEAPAHGTDAFAAHSRETQAQLEAALRRQIRLLMPYDRPPSELGLCPPSSSSTFDATAQPPIELCFQPWGSLASHSCFGTNGQLVKLAVDRQMRLSELLSIIVPRIPLAEGLSVGQLVLVSPPPSEMVHQLDQLVNECGLCDGDTLLVLRRNETWQPPPPCIVVRPPIPGSAFDDAVQAASVELQGFTERALAAHPLPTNDAQGSSSKAWARDDPSSKGLLLHALRAMLTAGGRRCLFFDSRRGMCPVGFSDCTPWLPTLSSAAADSIIIAMTSLEPATTNAALLAEWTSVYDEAMSRRYGSELRLKDLISDADLRSQLERSFTRHCSAAFGVSESAITELRIVCVGGMCKVHFSAVGWSTAQRSAVHEAAAWFFCTFPGYRGLYVHPLFSMCAFDLASLDDTRGDCTEFGGGTWYSMGDSTDSDLLSPYYEPAPEQLWRRFGLHVRGKYADGDAWLHPFGDDQNWWRAYHGPTAHSLEGTARGGQLGHGFYVTPHLERAATRYCGVAELPGAQRYALVFQSAVRPGQRLRIGSPGAKSAVRELYSGSASAKFSKIFTGRYRSEDSEWTVEAADVRPYGILMARAEHLEELWGVRCGSGWINEETLRSWESREAAQRLEVAAKPVATQAVDAVVSGMVGEVSQVAADPVAEEAAKKKAAADPVAEEAAKGKAAEAAAKRKAAEEAAPIKTAEVAKKQPAEEAATGKAAGVAALAKAAEEAAAPKAAVGKAAGVAANAAAARKATEEAVAAKATREIAAAKAAKEAAEAKAAGEVATRKAPVVEAAKAAEEAAEAKAAEEDAAAKAAVAEAGEAEKRAAAERAVAEAAVRAEAASAAKKAANARVAEEAAAARKAAQEARMKAAAQSAGEAAKRPGGDRLKPPEWVNANARALLLRNSLPPGVAPSGRRPSMTVAIAPITSMGAPTAQKKEHSVASVPQEPFWTRCLPWAVHAVQEIWLRHTLERQRILVGGSHPDTIAVLTSLQKLKHTQGDREAELPLLQEVLAARREAYGDLDASTLKAINNLGTLCYQMGDLDSAAPLLTEALAGQRRKFGDTHVDTLKAIDNLAVLKRDQKDLNGAHPLLSEVLAAKRAVYGNSNASTLRAVNNLGDLYYEMGDLDSAAPLLTEALVGQRRKFGDTHADTLKAIETLAMLRWDRQDLNGAHPLLSDVLKGRRSALGATHDRTLSSMYNLASLELARGEGHRAVPLLTEALATHTVQHGTEAEETRALADDLMRVLAAQGEVRTEAEAEAEAAAAVAVAAKVEAEEAAVEAEEAEAAQFTARAARVNAEKKVAAAVAAERAPIINIEEPNLESVPDYDRTHQPLALCDLHVYQPSPCMCILRTCACAWSLSGRGWLRCLTR